ncbi:MAG: hypothetical protein GY696_05745 [Gammaproteobacteria bacterium]|nr:hypothetical protein [Gammaproteobacteria bacterium]
MDSYKYLGVLIDPQLSFLDHARKTAAKTRQALGCLSRLTRKFVPRRVLNTIYRQVILPSAYYAVDIWIRLGRGSTGPLELMEKSHKFAAQIVSNNYDWNCSYPDLLGLVGWKCFTHLVWEHKIGTFWSYAHGRHY